MRLEELDNVEELLSFEEVVAARSARANRRERRQRMEEEALAEQARAQADVDAKRAYLLRNFLILKESTGRRHEFALYRMWSYLDVTKETLAEFERQNCPGSPYHSVKRLSVLFGDIFAEQCMKAESCVFKQFLPDDNPAPRCELEGCTNIVGWGGAPKGRWNRFCSRAHSLAYAKAHPWGDHTKSLLAKEEKALAAIKSGDITTQRDLAAFMGWSGLSGTNRAGILSRRMEREKMITRKRVLQYAGTPPHPGRGNGGKWTFKLEAVSLENAKA